MLLWPVGSLARSFGQGVWPQCGRRCGPAWCTGHRRTGRNKGQSSHQTYFSSSKIIEKSTRQSSTISWRIRTEVLICFRHGSGISFNILWTSSINLLSVMIFFATAQTCLKSFSLFSFLPEREATNSLCNMKAGIDGKAIDPISRNVTVTLLSSSKLR